jgi:hypothetical protein
MISKLLLANNRQMANECCKLIWLSNHSASATNQSFHHSTIFQPMLMISDIHIDPAYISLFYMQEAIPRSTLATTWPNRQCRTADRSIGSSVPAKIHLLLHPLGHVERTTNKHLTTYFLKRENVLRSWEQKAVPIKDMSPQPKSCTDGCPRRVASSVFIYVFINMYHTLRSYVPVKIQLLLHSFSHVKQTTNKHLTTYFL